MGRMHGGARPFDNDKVTAFAITHTCVASVSELQVVTCSMYHYRRCRNGESGICYIRIERLQHLIVVVVRVLVVISVYGMSEHSRVGSVLHDCCTGQKPVM